MRGPSCTSLLTAALQRVALSDWDALKRCKALPTGCLPACPLCHALQVIPPWPSAATQAVAPAIHKQDCQRRQRPSQPLPMVSEPPGCCTRVSSSPGAVPPPSPLALSLPPPHKPGRDVSVGMSMGALLSSLSLKKLTATSIGRCSSEAGASPPPICCSPNLHRICLLPGLCELV